jgi:hypothetical protein
VCYEPPFTRSVGGNLLFGSLPEADRKKAQEKLKRVVRRRELQASIIAGLGSVFVAVADRYIKPGGRIALVLPKALISGVAWEPTRELLGSKYRLEYLVASHDPLQWNFSESTDLSEVLLVARKENPKAPEPARATVALNLWRNPATNFDALAVCQALKTRTAPHIASGQGALEVFVGHERFGEAIGYPWEELKAWGSWIMPCAFAQSELLRVAYHLLRGQLYLPGHGQMGEVALCPLKNFATLGRTAGIYMTALIRALSQRHILLFGATVHRRFLPLPKNLTPIYRPCLRRKKAEIYAGWKTFGPCLGKF